MPTIHSALRAALLLASALAFRVPGASAEPVNQACVGFAVKTVEFGLPGSSDPSLASVRLVAGQYPLQIKTGPVTSDAHSLMQRTTLEATVVDPSTGLQWQMSVTIDSTLINGHAFQNVPQLHARRADDPHSPMRLISHLGNKMLARLPEVKPSDRPISALELLFLKNDLLIETRSGKLQLFSPAPGVAIAPGRAILYLSLRANGATYLHSSRMSGEATLDREPGAWSIAFALISLESAKP